MKTTYPETDVEAVASQPGVQDTVDKSASTMTPEEIEQAAALASYVPNTAAEKRLVRKLDFVLLPCLWWMYILAYVDRGNVANANAAGLSTDLKLSDDDYSLIVSIFFIGYTLLEVGSNLLLNKFRPSHYLTTIMAIWGACVAAMSTANSRGSFLVGRFFLGCIEAGLFPGALYLLTCWYKKDEIGKRFALFYTSGTVSPALGGIMAGSVISGLDGKMGWSGWRWLFLIEGVATVFFAIVFVFVLIDYPTNTTKFFSKEECQLAYVRILSDRQTSVQQNAARLTAWQSVWAVLADPRSYAFLTLYILNSTATSISYFVPVTLKTMGYTSVTAQWMTVPIWISGAVIMVILSTSSDHFRERRWHTVGCMLLAFVCSIVCLTTTAAAARYAMLCFYIGALYTGIAQILNWTSEAMALPDQKRSVALAFVNSWGNLSIIWGSRLWPSGESPGYKTGFTAVAVFTGFAAVLASVMPYLFSLLPKEPRTKAERDLIAIQAGQAVERED
ncbi:major facilitator superfamily domain-containing protein [Microdochium trichocladiopsis]|uniref:Major facilitator superfamily domain-containing protein n=1 Tax=Microdochium trichocladiopsis TaxID=1682393 RepID=A0A9P8XY86_9PEZI|nr:major facilitator superfamily domain-containing protein [Microdochium trichocladiopsis]KAH7024769.1 major facilitator superfamily domain-containing protein [Microdochium trichocladiopsis]